jgi:hypothetical protein
LRRCSQPTASGWADRHLCHEAWHHDLSAERSTSSAASPSRSGGYARIARAASRIGSSSPAVSRTMRHRHRVTNTIAPSRSSAAAPRSRVLRMVMLAAARILVPLGSRTRRGRAGNAVHNKIDPAAPGGRGSGPGPPACRCPGPTATPQCDWNTSPPGAAPHLSAPPAPRHRPRRRRASTAR